MQNTYYQDSSLDLEIPEIVALFFQPSKITSTTQIEIQLLKFDGAQVSQKQSLMRERELKMKEISGVYLMG